MGRGRRAKLSDEFLAQMVLEHHVDAMQVRKGGKGAGVTRVHHVKWGWMPVDQFYLLEEVRTGLAAAIPKIVDGGYRLKQAIYGFEVEILGTDIPVPIGAGLFAAMAGKMALSLKDGNPKEAAKWAALIALPFGELLAMWILTNEALGIVGGIFDVLTQRPEGGTGRSPR